MKKCDEITAHEAHRAWDYFFHDSKTNETGLFEHISRSWYFVHSFRSTGLAFFIGFLCFAVLLIVLSTHEPKIYCLFITPCILFLISYFCASLFFICKSKSTMRFIERFEVLVEHNYKKKIEGILTNIVKMRNKKQI